MLTQLLTYLVRIIKLQQQIILILVTQLTNIYMHSKIPRLEKPTYQRFNQFKADEKLPLLAANTDTKQLDYQQRLQEYFQQHQKPLKPVKRRKPFKYPEVTCPHCGAPNEYLYSNGGGQTDLLLCKICAHQFRANKTFSKELVLRCPYCRNKLAQVKQHVHFKVWRCQNLQCAYRQREISRLTPSELEQYQTNPNQFKVRYRYREYDFNLKGVANESTIQPIVNLDRIQASPQVLGISMTYYVNYGLSAAKTAAIMYDVHGVKISKQTILNYAQAIATNVRPFLDNYPYQLSSNFVGDETYLRVKGKWNYLFYFYDVDKKIILADYVTPKRTTESACIAIYQVLQKFPTIPADLRFTVDDNPIYRVARLYYAQHEGISFDLNIVKGLTNESEVAKQHRPAKQTIERLNRSLKANYRPMSGFKSASGSVTYVTLYSLCHNFLLRHQSLDYRVPVEIPELKGLTRMPDKWLKLIEIAQEQLPTA